MPIETFNTIPAAAGYPQYSGTNLIPPIFSDRMLERFYATSIFGEISNTDFLGELTKLGDQITFLREPDVIVRDYIKDGTLKHDTLEVDSFTMVVDKAKYFSVKIDRVDEFQMGPKFDMLWNRIGPAASRRMAEQIDCTILSKMYTKAHCSNRGAAAGCLSGGYNLGSVGAPVALTSANILEFLTNLAATLTEQNIPRENRFVILPPIFENTIMNSELRSAQFTGTGPSQILNGRIPGTIAGFTIYVSPYVPRVYDALTNSFAYYIIAGVPAATAFASQIQETRVVDGGHSNFDKYMQGLAVYGFDVIYPEALAVGYVRAN